MSEYDDRSKFTNEFFVNNYLFHDKPWMEEKDKEEIRAALLKRMKPEAGWVEITEGILQDGDVVETNAYKLPVCDYVGKPVSELKENAPWFKVLRPVPAQPETEAPKEDGLGRILEIALTGLRDIKNEWNDSYKAGRKMRTIADETERRVLAELDDLHDSPVPPAQPAIEKAYNIAAAQLIIATMMLRKFADDCCYFSVQCDAEHALAEIAALDVKE